MYDQTRYCCGASRERRDTLRVAARVNVVSTPAERTDRPTTTYQRSWLGDDRLCARPAGPARPGQPRATRTASICRPRPATPRGRRAMINCDVVLYDERRRRSGELHGQITARRRRHGRAGPGSRLTVGLQRLKAAGSSSAALTLAIGAVSRATSCCCCWCWRWRRCVVLSAVA